MLKAVEFFCFFYSCAPDLGGSMCSTCVDVGFVNTMLLMEMRFSVVFPF